MKNFNEFINEAISYKDRGGKSFKIKGMSFIYTEQGGRFYGTYLYDVAGRFYGTYLYDVAKTSNVQHTSKISIDETNKLLKSLGIKSELPNRYDDRDLDKICKEVSKKGVVCDHGDYMDVS